METGERTSRRPVGLLALALALALAIGGLLAGQAYALRLAERYARVVAAPSLPIKYEDLTFERAALASGDLLPIYGSSELFCCGAPDLGSEFFAQEPTGFDPFSVGRAGTGDLFFFETFAALGHDLTGKRIVLSDSPPWFFGPRGITGGYDGNFSPEIATLFAFSAPIPMSLRSAGARQMLAHPRSLRGLPLLRMALTDLADPTVLHLLAYTALDPLGRLDAWGLELRDAWNTVQFIDGHRAQLNAALHRLATHRAPAAQPLTAALAVAGSGKGGRGGSGTRLLGAGAHRRTATSGLTGAPGFGLTGPAAAAALPVPGRPIDWSRILAAATRIQQVRGGNDPFGFALVPAQRRVLAPALRLYCQGLTNRAGQVYPYPAAWARNMLGSAEWTALGLELRALRQLGAHALLWNVPMPGVYNDYTALSQPARQAYYARYDAMVAGSGFPAISFRSHDEDRYFMANTGAHYSPRGWVFADRALNLFWHGQSKRIPRALARMESGVPAVGPPALPLANNALCARLPHSRASARRHNKAASSGRHSATIGSTRLVATRS